MAENLIRRSLPLASFLAACTSAATPPRAEQAPRAPTAWSIAVEAHPCIDETCARYDLWLDARGDVLWFGRSNVDHLGALRSTVLPEVAQPFWDELSALRGEGEPGAGASAPASSEPEVHRVCGGGDVRYRYRFEVVEAGRPQAFELHVEPTVCDPAPWLSFVRRLELMAGRYRLDGEQLYCVHASGGGPLDPECMGSPDRSAWWLHQRG